MNRALSSAAPKVLWVLATMLPATLCAAATSVDSGDGLTLRFANDGRIGAIALDGKVLPLAAPAALSLRDAAQNAAPTGEAREATTRANAAEGGADTGADGAGDEGGDAGGPFVPVAASVSEIKNGVQLRGALPQQKLEVVADWTRRGQAIALDGFVRDVSGGDRCIDLKVLLPLNCRGWNWGGFPEDSAIQNKVIGLRRGGSAVYPIAAVSDAAHGAGLSLALPPTHPTRIETGADESGVWVMFRIGLAAQSTPSRQTAFRLLIYRHDAPWGFRAAVQKYYEMFREPYFTRRVPRIGAWTVENPSRLRNPDLYAYHEAGSRTWGAAGQRAESDNSSLYNSTDKKAMTRGPLGATVADYEKLSEFEGDEKLGILSLPYIIVGQRQIFQLPAMPPDYQSAIEVFEKWTTQRPILFEGPPQAVSYRSAEQIKTIIRNSGIYDSTHRLDLVRREYQGPALTFTQNPNPKLFAKTGKLTIARYALDEYLPMMFRSKYVDGCYVDSLGRWCGFYNYRKDHFPDSTVPLTYAGSPPQACLWNLQSHAEFLWELSRRLHAQNKMVFANGVHTDRVMLGFAVDAMGMEGLPTYDTAANFYPRRVAAATKPYCFLNARGESSPRLWNSALYMGYLLGCNTDQGASEERKYLPTIIRLNQAGWQPVTHARATPAAAGIERWGEAGKSVYFTVMNRSQKPLQAEVRLDRATLKLNDKAQVREMISGRAVALRAEPKYFVLSLPLAAEQAVALEIQQ